MKRSHLPAPRASRVLRTACASALLSACATSTPPAQQAPTPPQATAPAEPKPAAAPAPKPTYGTFGVDTAGMKKSIAPGDSFYGHVNGTWQDTTEIPADRSAYGMFTRLAEEAAQRTRALIESSAQAGTPDGQKISDFYASFMDEAAIEAKGATPLKPELERLAAIANRKELAAALGATLRADVDPLNTAQVDTDRILGLWVSEDLNDSTRYVAYLLQGGLGMPDRDYYLVENEKFAQVRKAYQQHIANMLRLAGQPDAEAKAGRIYALEREIARVHWAQVDTRDVPKANNPWKRDDFARKAPGLDWAAYFGAAGLGQQADFIVWQPSAVTGIAKLVGSQPLQTWKDYLAFHLIERKAHFLSKSFVDESFAFNGQTLTGTKQLRERWKRGVDATNGALGEAVGKLYVEKYFPPRAKAEAEAMVHNIVTAFSKRVDALTWMAPETKAHAKEKLSTLLVGIGHPDKWRDYSHLEVVRGDAYGNVERASLFEYRRNLAKLGKPVDRSEWFMVPQEVNALNAPQLNSISFPAAILQPPFFDANADAAVNYAAIGAVIGHELSHSFDDTGALFDAQGKLANWWTKEDGAKFQAAGQALAAQYSAYHPLPDMTVNGELTLGENIADVAGLSAAYDAYKLSLGGKEAPVLDGYTGDQRFFLGFGQVWRNKYREPLLRRLLLTDGHSPGEFRASTVRNLDAWYPAFDVKPGQALYLAPEQRVHVW